VRHARALVGTTVLFKIRRDSAGDASNASIGFYYIENRLEK
jgi:hypothetical protein